MEEVLPSMETIDETGESTTTTNTEEEVNQLIQQLQEELIAEDKRHDNTLAYFNQRVKEEKERQSKQHRVLGAKLLQALTQQGSTADSDYWLSNRKIQKKEPPKKPSKQEKALIRARVKKAYTASKKK